MALACGLGLATTAMFLAAMPFNRHFAMSRDYAVYWATGQEVAHHGNPYDAAQMGTMEHAGGFDRTGSFYMRNPPWGLWLTLPLGYVGAQAGALPWSLLLIALLVAAVRMLRGMPGEPRGGTGRPGNGRDAPGTKLPGSEFEWIGYCFPPALECVWMGQTSLFLLLGLVIFLGLHRTRPFWAGAGLWLCTLKPHLFVPFGVALLAWIVVERRWRVAGGAVAAMAASCGVTALADPAAWRQYLHWAGASGIAKEPIPCLGVVLRNAIDPRAEWLTFVPCAVAAVWALAYYARRRRSWDWMENGALLVLVGLVAAPYCWVLDQCVALPALLIAAAVTQRKAAVGVLGAIYLAVELQPLVFHAGLDSAWYVWVAPAWLGWWLWARRGARSVDETTTAVAGRAPTAS